MKQQELRESIRASAAQGMTANDIAACWGISVAFVDEVLGAEESIDVENYDDVPEEEKAEVLNIEEGKKQSRRQKFGRFSRKDIEQQIFDTFVDVMSDGENAASARIDAAKYLNEELTERNEQRVLNKQFQHGDMTQVNIKQLTLAVSAANKRLAEKGLVTIEAATVDE